MSDPFQQKNNRDRAKEIIDRRKAAETEVTKAAQQRIADAKKPKFNDVPVYRPQWSI